MLRKERELDEARKKLAMIRQQQYKFLPSELREDGQEQWERAVCVCDTLVSTVIYGMLRTFPRLHVKRGGFCNGTFGRLTDPTGSSGRLFLYFIFKVHCAALPVIINIQISMCLKSVLRSLCFWLYMIISFCLFVSVLHVFVVYMPCGFDDTPPLSEERTQPHVLLYAKSMQMLSCEQTHVAVMILDVRVSDCGDMTRMMFSMWCSSCCFNLKWRQWNKMLPVFKLQ